MQAPPQIPNAAEPCWQDYMPLIESLPFNPFPAPDQLNQLLPATAETVSGHPIHFRDAASLGPDGYEQRIAASGMVATRAGNWHDLFNALAWVRFSRIKSALNARHLDGMGHSAGGRRGALRDALTLFDECGALIISDSDALLGTLAAKDWHGAFWIMRDTWEKRCAVFVTGHALLEKFLEPYRSMTANALLLRVGADDLGQSREKLIRATDLLLAELIRDGACLNAPADLAPLPLAGIPQWWTEHEQDEAFYRDPAVFRPPRPDADPAPVFSLS